MVPGPTAQITLLETERSQALAELQRMKELLTASEKSRSELAAQNKALQSDAETTAEEMTVLMAHLQEARRPHQSTDVQVKRLTEELAAKSLRVDALVEENRSLRATIERSRAALEEREFLIRRLERSDSLNVSGQGRTPPSADRVGTVSNVHAIGSASSLSGPLPAECTAEFTRIDGQHNTSHPLVRRTRIGRAPGCELQIDSSSVSRHHALVLVGQRDIIIEDLNSTNGVLVNGRKIARQMLHDGDTVSIGDAEFRVRIKLPRSAEQTT